MNSSLITLTLLRYVDSSQIHHKAIQPYLSQIHELFSDPPLSLNKPLLSQSLLSRLSYSLNLSPDPLFSSSHRPSHQIPSQSRLAFKFSAVASASFVRALVFSASTGSVGVLVYSASASSVRGSSSPPSSQTHSSSSPPSSSFGFSTAVVVRVLHRRPFSLLLL